MKVQGRNKKKKRGMMGPREEIWEVKINTDKQKQSNFLKKVSDFTSGSDMQAFLHKKNY